MDSGFTETTCLHSGRNGWSVSANACKIAAWLLSLFKPSYNWKIALPTKELSGWLYPCRTPRFSFHCCVWIFNLIRLTLVL